MHVMTGGVALLSASLALLAFGPGAQAPTGSVRGPYYGQRLPGATPEPFAVEAAAALGMTKAPAFSSDGREMFWSRATGRHTAALMSCRLAGDTWAVPAPLPFSTGEFFDHNPAVSADGRRLVFASNRPIPGKKPTTLPGTDVPTSDLWMSERTPGGWSAPIALGAALNTAADEDCPVLAANGTLYFSSSRPTPHGAPGAIYRSRLVGGRFDEPERLPPPVSDAGEMVSGIAPDDSYILFYSMKSGEAGGLCVSFRGPGGSWGPPARLAPLLGGLRAYAASVTLDGRSILLTTSGPGAAKLHWVSTALLDGARPGK